MFPPKISPQTRVGVGARTSGQTSQTEIDSSDGSSDSDLNRGDKTNQREHFPVPMPGSSPAITSATEEASKTFNSHSHQRNADESIEKPSPVVGVSGKSYRESTRAWLEANTRNNGGSSSGLDDDEKAKKGRSSSSKLLAKRTYGSPAFSPGSGIVGSARTSTTNTTPPTNGRRKGVNNARNRTRAGSDGSDRTSTPASGYAADCSPGGRDSARAAVIEGTKKLTKGRARFQAPASGEDSRSKGVEGGKDEVENSGPGEREDGGWTCDKCTYDNEVGI